MKSKSTKRCEEAVSRTIRRDEEIIASARFCGMPPKTADGDFEQGWHRLKCPFLEGHRRQDRKNPDSPWRTVGFYCTLADPGKQMLTMVGDRACRCTKCLEGENIGRSNLGQRILDSRDTGRADDKVDILLDALERIGIGKGPARVAFLRLLAFKYERWPEGLKVPYAEKGDEEAPFFSEAYLYNLLGKEEARTLLALVRRVGEALGLSWKELP